MEPTVTGQNKNREVNAEDVDYIKMDVEDQRELIEATLDVDAILYIIQKFGTQIEDRILARLVLIGRQRNREINNALPRI